MRVLCSAVCRVDQTIRTGKSFGLWSFVYFQEGIKTFSNSQIVHFIQQLVFAHFEQDELVRVFDNGRFNISFVNKNG